MKLILKKNKRQLKVNGNFAFIRKTENCLCFNQFDKLVKFANAFPCPSESFYEAKLWQFCGKQGAKDALIWNVAGLRLKFGSVGSRMGG